MKTARNKNLEFSKFRIFGNFGLALIAHGSAVKQPEGREYSTKGTASCVQVAQLKARVLQPHKVEIPYKVEIFGNLDLTQNSQIQQIWRFSFRFTTRDFAGAHPGELHGKYTLTRAITPRVSPRGSSKATVKGKGKGTAKGVIRSKALKIQNSKVSYSKVHRFNTKRR